MFWIGLQIIVSVFYFILIDVWQKVAHFRLTDQGDWLLFGVISLGVWLIADALFPTFKLKETEGSGS
jgi:hypothetical protein